MARRGPEAGPNSPICEFRYDLEAITMVATHPAAEPALPVEMQSTAADLASVGVAMTVGVGIWRRSCGSPGAAVDHGVRRTRFRRRSKFARPYICLLIILMRLTWPSTGPELWGRVRPAVTASRSRSRPVA